MSCIQYIRHLQLLGLCTPVQYKAAAGHLDTSELAISVVPKSYRYAFRSPDLESLTFPHCLKQMRVPQMYSSSFIIVSCASHPQIWVGMGSCILWESFPQSV